MPVPPNGVIYIRWWDVNEGGDDGVLGLDTFSFTATLSTFTPTVVITSPTNGNAFAAAAPITITAVPSMANPVTNVTFYRDNLSTVITNDTTNPTPSAVAARSSAGAGRHSHSPPHSSAAAISAKLRLAFR